MSEMGFFSWECNGCGHPALSMHAVDRVNAWMQNVIAFPAKDGGARFLVGEYDGYGRVYTADCDPEADDEGVSIVDVDGEWNPEVNDPVVFHAACWHALGEPIPSSTPWTPSENAADQGFFFGPADHAMPEPKNSADVAAGRRLAEAIKLEGTWN